MFENKFSEDWLRSCYRPIMGADGEGEEDENTPAPGEAEESSEETPAASGESSAEGGSEEGGNEAEEEAADADADEADRLRREREDLRQQVARAEAAARKAKQEAKEARESAAKKDGNWEQIAKERESELADANEKLTKAETRAYEAETELDSFKREVRVTRLAARLFFRDPKDALVQLKDQPEATGDEKSCERALRKLADDKPYLVDQKRARGRAMSGSGGNGAVLTAEQMKNMTTDEINDHWERVSGSLTRMGP